MKRSALELVNVLNVLRHADQESGDRSRLLDLVDHVIELDASSSHIWIDTVGRDWLNARVPARRWELSGSAESKRQFVADRWEVVEEEDLDDFLRLRAESQAVWLFLQYLSIRLDELTQPEVRVSQCESCGEYAVVSHVGEGACSNGHLLR